MSIKRSFIKSEIIPASHFPFVDIEKYTKFVRRFSDVSYFKTTPIRWYEFNVKSESRVVEVPHPILWDKIFDNFMGINKELVHWFSTQNSYGRHTPVSRKNNDFFYYKRKNNYIAFIKSVERSHQEMIQKYKSAFIFQIDIKNYFKSIYTHSLDWAISGSVARGKSIYRDDLGKRVDDFANKMNMKQTNGLLIGPNISRVLAEIIGIQCDNFIKTFCVENKYKFQVFRYVDDMYIISDNKINRDAFIDHFNHSLINWNVSVNDKKTENITRTDLANKLQKATQRQKNYKKVANGKTISDEQYKTSFLHYNSGVNISKKVLANPLYWKRIIKTIRKAENTIQLSTKRTSYSVMAYLVLERKITYSQFKKIVELDKKIIITDLNLIFAMRMLREHSAMMKKSDVDRMMCDYQLIREQIKIFVDKKDKFDDLHDQWELMNNIMNAGNIKLTIPDRDLLRANYGYN